VSEEERDQGGGDVLLPIMAPILTIKWLVYRAGREWGDMITLVKGRRAMGTSGHRAYGNRHLNGSRGIKSVELFTRRQSSHLQISVCHPKLQTSDQGGGMLGGHV
jgi:hypothetical protein